MIDVVKHSSPPSLASESSLEIQLQTSTLFLAFVNFGCTSGLKKRIAEKEQIKIYNQENHDTVLIYYLYLEALLQITKLSTYLDCS